MADLGTLSRGFDHLGEIAKTVGDLQGARTVTHELIQNADDAAGATQMRFAISGDGLEVWNDGEFVKCSDLTTDPDECELLSETGHRCDFHSFRRIASGDKRNRVGTTGAFGIGFTAVYQLTDRPELISSGEHWTIDEMEPEDHRISRATAPLDHQGTTFWLPWAREETEFRRRIHQPIVADARIDAFFQELVEAVPLAMVFLKRLRSIEVLSPLIRLRYDREDSEEVVGVRSTDDEVWSWFLLRGNFDEAAEEIRARHPNVIEQQRGSSVAVAFPLDHERETGTLYASLPTEESTHLPFHINAEFYPASDRKRVRFEESPESEFNRAAVSAAARLLAGNLEGLPEQIGDQAFVRMLVAALQLAKRAKQEQIDSCLEAIWAQITPALGVAKVVPVVIGAPATVVQARLTNDDIETDAATSLSEIDVSLVDPDVRDGWYQLTEVGVRPLNLGHVVSGLENCGITTRNLLDDLPGTLATKEGLNRLWAVLELLLSTGRSSDESRKRLRQCAVAPASDGASWPFAEVLSTDADTEELLRRVGVTAVYLDVGGLGTSRPALANLAAPVTADRALSLLEETGLSEAPCQQTDAERLVLWFQRHSDQLTDDQLARIARLPIFTTAAGLQPLQDLVLPGGFDDPLGLSVVVLADDRIEPFLRKLGARQLTFTSYCTTFVPEAYATGNLEHDRRCRLVQLLASRLSEIHDNADAKAALRPLELVQCTDGDWRAAEAVYLTAEVQAALGPSAPVAVAPPDHRGAYDALHTWLGVASKPRATDIVKACKSLTGAPWRNIHQVEAIVKHLQQQGSEAHESMTAYATVLELGWLPAQGEQRPGCAAGAIYSIFRRHLFHSQAKFLDIPAPTQRACVDALRWLGVESEPTPTQVVAHLLWCSDRHETPSNDLWEYLDQNASDPALTSLKTRRCLLLSNGSYVTPREVYWDENPFGRWRYQLSENFTKYQALLDRLGVPRRPHPSDALDVLQDIAAHHGGERAPLLEQDRPVVHRCWQLLGEGLLNGQIEERHVSALRNSEVVLNALGWLRQPAEVFFRDSELVARRFGEAVRERLIDRPEGLWPALAAASVRNLSDAVRTDIVEMDGGSSRGRAGERVASRRTLLRRVLEAHDPHATPYLDLFYECVDVLHVTRLEVLQSLEIGAEPPITSEAHALGALYDEDNQRLLVVESVGLSPAWAEIARELVRGLNIQSGQLSGLSSAVKDVLSADSDEAAAHDLDVLGYPALDEFVPVAVEQHVAEDIGGTPGEAGSESSTQQTERNETLGDAPAESASPQSARTNGDSSAQGASPSGAESSPASDVETHTTRSAASAASRSGEVQTRLRSYVTPVRSGSQDPTVGRHIDIVERAGVAAALDYERQHGRDPTEMPPMNPGYDIESVSPEGVVRFIEVKATDGVWDARGVALSSTQFVEAQRRQEEFWLYVVEDALAAPRVHPIRDPASKIDQYLFDDGWRVASEPDAQPVPQLSRLNVAKERIRPDLIRYFEASNQHIGDTSAGDGWVPCRDEARRDDWFAVRVAGHGLGMAFYGGVAYVEPLDRTPEDTELVLVALDEQVDPDSGSRFSLRRWSPDRDLGGNQLALRLSTDGSAEPLTVLRPDRLVVLGTVQKLLRATEVRRGHED